MGKQGTSPRTRGKLAAAEKVTVQERNIPAHAGKTLCPSKVPVVASEHPRARGENAIFIAEN